MGWTCMQGTRAEIVESELRDHGNAKRGFRVLKRSWSGWNQLWVLCENWRPGDAFDEALVVTRFIGVLLLKSYPSHGEWCAKFVDSDCGPFEVGAPLAWLSEVTIDPDRKTANEWYARVREFHRKRGTGVKLKVGDPVKLIDGSVSKIHSLRPLMCADAGYVRLIKRRHIVWDAASP